MNILANPFEPWVTEQIVARQQVLGKSSNIPPNILKYYSNKTSFLRLASSVNLTNNGPEIDGKSSTLENSVLKKLINNGIPENLISGDTLAKNFILYGGAVSSNDEGFNGLNAGLNLKNELFKGGYGWGGIEDRGYVPMPGITGANVQYYNNGALAKTTIDIKCFSKKQFQLIDVLYMRPGYTLLLEFGWTLYLDKNLNLNEFDSFYTKPLRTLLKPESTDDQYSIYAKIKEERKDRYGNYEAVYGKISNFSWRFNPNGSYDCQISLISMGDVIESLKINTAPPVKSILTGLFAPATNVVSTSQTTPQDPSAPPLIANANKTILNRHLYDLYQKYKSNQGINSFDYELDDYPDPSNNFTSKKLTINKGIIAISGTTNNTDEENQSPQVYMTLGSLLAFIEAKLLLYNNKNGNKIPITRFNVNFTNLDEDKNYITKFPGQFSSDPNICLVPVTYSNLPDKDIPLSNIITSPLNKVLLDGARWHKGTYLGRLMNIYININFISKILVESPQSDDNSISLLDFIDTLFNSTTRSLGAINRIRIQNNQDNLITFIEEIPQRFNPGDEDIPEKSYARFNVFGVKPDTEGSFIRSINLGGEISNDFSTMISIGSQANANQLSEDATAFSKYNAGLEDRIVKEKHSYYPIKNESEQNQQKNIEEHFRTNVNPSENSLLVNIYNKLQFTSENIDALVSHNTQYSKLVVGELVKLNQIQSPFFLPFKLSLEMDGLSGMILYQKFLITDDVLPPSYEKDQVELQLIGINHTVNPHKWTTSIDALSVPADPLADIIKPETIRPPQENPTTIGKCGPKNISSVPASNNTNENNRLNAITKSFNSVFQSFGEVKGICAKWTYNLARNYVKILRNSPPSSQVLNAGGNANQNIQYYNNLTKLGYSQTKVGSNITKQELINFINNTNWNYGDVIVYYANDGAGTHVTYGHTQIYVGRLTPTKWATSVKNNYGSSFVYSDRNSNCWDFYVFKAPSN